MNRVLTVLLIFIVGAVAALLVLGYFAYVIAAGPPEETHVRGLTSSVVVGFSEQGTSRVAASSLTDAMAGLGYAQAASRTWPLIVYRAAATGGLSTLVGQDGLAVDERTFQLGIAAGAEQAYELLNEEDRGLLASFSRGVNAALADRSVLRDPSLVLSGHVPGPWQPWHTLAIERLFSWLAADPAAEQAGPSPDRPARDFLRVHDLNQSLIVTSEWPSEPGLFVRYVWGSSALPVLFESSLAIGGRPPVRGACILGTPFFTAARTETRAWAFLPEQSFSVETLVLDSIAVDVRRRLLTLTDGSERLVSILTSGGAVLLGKVAPPNGGSGTFVSWRGQGPVTDASEWLGLIQGRDPAFELNTGTGVVLSQEGEVSYAPGDTRSLAGGRLIGSSPFLLYSERRISSLMADSRGFNPRLWFGDTYSHWGAEWTPRILESLSGTPVRNRTEEEARSYLQNWDHRFDPASIGASIFQTWAEEYHTDNGRWPGMVSSDAEARNDSIAAAPDLRDPFERAVARLAQQYGSDLSLWRWEDVNAAEVSFPVLGRSSSSTSKRPLSRYAPRTIPGNGHPTTPNWSPIAVADGKRAANSWEGWTRMTVPGDWTLRRWYPNVSRGVSSSVGPDESSIVTSLEASMSTQTRLIPAADANELLQTSESGG